MISFGAVIVTFGKEAKSVSGLGRVMSGRGGVGRPRLSDDERYVRRQEDGEKD